MFSSLSRGLSRNCDIGLKVRSLFDHPSSLWHQAAAAKDEKNEKRLMMCRCCA